MTKLEKAGDIFETENASYVYLFLQSHLTFQEITRLGIEDLRLSGWGEQKTEQSQPTFETKVLSQSLPAGIRLLHWIELQETKNFKLFLKPFNQDFKIEHFARL